MKQRESRSSKYYLIELLILVLSTHAASYLRNVKVFPVFCSIVSWKDNCHPPKITLFALTYWRNVTFLHILIVTLIAQFPQPNYVIVKLYILLAALGRSPPWCFFLFNWNTWLIQCVLQGPNIQKTSSYSTRSVVDHLLIDRRKDWCKTHERSHGFDSSNWLIKKQYARRSRSFLDVRIANFIRSVFTKKPPSK